MGTTPLNLWVLSEYDCVCPGQRVLRTPQDRIIAARFEDSYLFEGPLRTQVNPYVLSGNLNVRFTLYRYAAFTAERKSICVTTGTGNIVPTVLAGF